MARTAVFSRSMIENGFEQACARVRQADGILDRAIFYLRGLARRRYHVDRCDERLRLIDRAQHLTRHGAGYARVDVDHARVRDSRSNLAFQGAARFGAHVL